MGLIVSAITLRKYLPIQTTFKLELGWGGGGGETLQTPQNVMRKSTAAVNPQPLLHEEKQTETIQYILQINHIDYLKQI